MEMKADKEKPPAEETTHQWYHLIHAHTHNKNVNSKTIKLYSTHALQSSQLEQVPPQWSGPQWDPWPWTAGLL